MINDFPVTRRCRVMELVNNDEIKLISCKTVQVTLLRQRLDGSEDDLRRLRDGPVTADIKAGLPRRIDFLKRTLCLQ